MKKLFTDVFFFVLDCFFMFLYFLFYGKEGIKFIQKIREEEKAERRNDE